MLLKLLSLFTTPLLLVLSVSARADVPVVFTSILPLKGLTQEIVENDLKILVMVESGQSPETYEPKPSQLKQITEAKIFFAINVPFERAWLPKIRKTNPQLKVVDLSKGISPLKEPPSKKLHHHHSHEEDPHVWSSPKNVIEIVKKMKESLIQAFPNQRDRYEKKANNLISRLNELDQEVEERLKKTESKSFLVFHPAWGHFARDYHLEQISIEVDGKEPGAQELRDIIELAKKKNIKNILVQEQFSTGQARVIANAITGRIVKVDPLAENYFESTRELVAAITGN